MTLVGTTVLRVEDHHLLIGDTCFVADVDLPGALHVRYVTSTMAHAQLVSVDVAAARAVSGVVDVLVASDVGVDPLAPMVQAAPVEMVRPLLAEGVVRFVGEPIVAVVAETEHAAADGVAAVEVEYEPLPAVVRVEESRRDGVLLFPGAGTNVVASNRGGAVGALPFDECEVVVEADFVNQRVAPCPIETRVAASVWGDDGRLTHYASCQGAHPIRTQLSTVHGIPPDQIRVVTADVGGSFGAKGRAYPEELLLPVIAKRTGRPVRWMPSRSDDMVGLGHSRAQHQQVRIGGMRDGTIRCLEVHVLADAGAYPGIAPNLANNTGNLLPGPYRIEHVRWTNECVLTNTTPITAYRGAGRPEAAAIMDRAVDRFAAEVGLDPVVVRRKNLLRPDEFPWRSPTGLTYDSGAYERALDLALENVDYDGLRVEQRRRREDGDAMLLGIGVSVFIDRTAGVPGSEYGSIELLASGDVLVKTGSSPYGQGHHTAWAMLVADRTGLPMDRITVVHGDTDVVPRGGVTGGSRSAQKAGSAVAQATDALVAEARRRAADLLEASVDDIVLEEGVFHVRGAPGATTVNWTQLASYLRATRAAGVGSASEQPAAERQALRPKGLPAQSEAISQSEAMLRCEADFEGDGPTFPFGAYVAVVEVDTETGFLTLERIVTVDDAGTILNPMLALGQVHGGLAQGIAQGMFEEFVYDDDGNPLTSTFADYGIPTAADLPSFECSLTETPSPNNPLGFKGIAESGTIGGPPALQNAVVDALSHLGVRHLDLPVTPERIWQAITEATRIA
ncbi:MAG TPA: xanthine dehydrogenase family protein molybdopterin-binding subunit [Acidimicrobiales bacterium]|nr:xanthine dehydrogenase family protein molybdopterin-binding subunit [Acidimicrobiales bacterium]